MSVIGERFSRDALAVVAVLTLYGAGDSDSILKRHGHGLTIKRINDALSELSIAGIVEHELSEGNARGNVLRRQIVWRMTDKDTIAQIVEARRIASLTPYDLKYPGKLDWDF